MIRRFAWNLGIGREKLRDAAGHGKRVVKPTKESRVHAIVPDDDPVVGKRKRPAKGGELSAISPSVTLVWDEGLSTMRVSMWKKEYDDPAELKAELIRKYRITEALLNKSREPKRIAALDAKRSHLRQREKIFNENVQVRTISQQIAPLKHSRPLLQFINREKDWFEKSPAFKMAQAYIQENWIKCKSGAWMHKVRSTLFFRQYPTPSHTI